MRPRGREEIAGFSFRQFSGFAIGGSDTKNSGGTKIVRGFGICKGRGKKRGCTVGASPLERG